MMNEADTCRVLITPALQQAGWGDPVWRMAAAHATRRTGRRLRLAQYAPSQAQPDTQQSKP